MFQLVIKRASSELSYIFDQSRLVIGSKGEPPVDLTLSESDLLPVHLIIYRKGKDYYAENVGQDPRTRISGAPFWRKKLKTGDSIEIKKITFSFIQLASPAHPEDQEETLETPIEDKPQEVESKNLFNDLSPLENPPPKSKKNFIESLTPVHSESPFHLWLLLSTLAILFLLLFGFTLTISFKDKATTQKFQAARRVADLAMLLTYAQVNHLEPANRSFLDPDFLKELAPNVLPPNGQNLDWIDVEGRLIGTNHLIRIYSDGDGERFLVVALPEYHLLQQLAPSWAILLDSEEMMIRATKDVREISRFFAQAAGLEGINRTLISEKIQESEILSLKELDEKSGNAGFLPPEELAFIDSQNPNLIYQAPRYYLLQEPIIEMISNSSDEGGNSSNEAKLKKEMEKLTRFPSMIFYTSKGIEQAIETRKALSKQFPNEKYLVGYLEIDPLGKLKESHLLMMAGKQSFEEIAMVSSEELYREGHDPFADYDQHPLFQELENLLDQRRDHLKPYQEPLIALFDDNLYHINRQFFYHHKTLFESYQEALKKEQDWLTRQANLLFEKYVVISKTVSIPAFFSFLDLAGIDVSYEEEPLPITPTISEHKSESHQMEAAFTLVQNAPSIEILDQAVCLAHDLLNTQNLTDPHLLHSFQNQLRSIVIYKLETLLWVPQPGGDELSKEKARWIVSRILKNGYISEPDQREFYLCQISAELDERSEKMEDDTLYLTEGEPEIDKS